LTGGVSLTYVILDMKMVHFRDVVPSQSANSVLTKKNYHQWWQTLKHTTFKIANIHKWCLQIQPTTFPEDVRAKFLQIFYITRACCLLHKGNKECMNYF